MSDPMFWALYLIYRLKQCASAQLAIQSRAKDHGIA